MTGPQTRKGWAGNRCGERGELGPPRGRPSGDAGSRPQRGERALGEPPPRTHGKPRGWQRSRRAREGAPRGRQGARGAVLGARKPLPPAPAAQLGPSFPASSGRPGRPSRRRRRRGKATAPAIRPGPLRAAPAQQRGLPAPEARGTRSPRRPPRRPPRSRQRRARCFPRRGASAPRPPR